MYPFDDQDLPAPGMPVAPQPQQQNPLLKLLPILFAAGAKIGGSPTTGAAALQGARRGDMLVEEQRRYDTSQQQRAQQIQFQQDQVAIQRQQQMEQRRQAALNSAADNLRMQKFTTKADYDKAITTYETMLGNAYGLRPNTLRAMVPFNGPDVKTKAADAVNALVKLHGPEVFDSGALIEVDRDGDGIAERMTVAEAAQLGEIAVARDPVTGKAIVPPKEVKSENIQEFDLVYKGLVDEFVAEKGRQPTDAEKGKLARQAGTKPSTGGGERPMTRYQRFTAQQSLRRDADKAIAPVRDLVRQVETMQAGLAQAKGGRRTAGVQAVINSFNRIMEPGSVTREAEYLRTAQGQPLLDSLRGKIESITKGGNNVTIETLEDAVALAEQIAENMATFADEQLSLIGGQADDFSIPRSAVVATIPRPKKRTQATTPAPTGHAQTPYRVGDVVTVNGQKVKVTKLLPDGKYEGTVVR